MNELFERMKTQFGFEGRDAEFQRQLQEIVDFELNRAKYVANTLLAAVAEQMPNPDPPEGEPQS